MLRCNSSFQSCASVESPEPSIDDTLEPQLVDETRVDGSSIAGPPTAKEELINDSAEDKVKTSRLSA